tara:strand:- start:150 stop:494 length:345 start_codon:yes stop_codon:yes gene_type:complete
MKKVTLTETARREIGKIIKDNTQLDDNEQTYLRVGVKGGGCSGFSYILDLTGNLKDGDQIVSEEDNIKVICDSKSLLYIGGTEIDFRDEVMGRGFVFENPNATATCGCGSSFAT